MVTVMNEMEGRRMREVFFKYYYEAPIENMDDKRMLDKLVRARHTEYTLNDEGKPCAKASSIGRGLHPFPPISLPATA